MSELAGYNTRVVVAPITGGTAGTVTLPLFPAPFGGVTIDGAWATAAGAVAANGSNYATMTLVNGGTAGTATTAVGTAGGTVGWSASTPAAFSVNTGAKTLTEGQWLVAKYAVTGSVTAPGDVAITIRYKHGKG